MFETEKDRLLKAFDEQVEADAKRKKQRKMININVEETSGVDLAASGSVGWAVIKEAGNSMSAQTKLDTAVNELISKGAAANTAQAIVQLLETNPELLIAVRAELEAAAVGVDPVTKAQQVAKPVAKADGGETAQQKLQAKGQAFFESERTKTVEQGVALAAQLFPDLFAQAVDEGIEGNVL